MLTELFLRPISVSVTQTSRGSRFKRFQNEGPFHFTEEALLLEAEGKIEYVVSCQGKSKFCEEQVQDKDTSSNLVY